MSNSFDIVIVGAGPAGTSCAYLLSGKGLRVALIDKEKFPRDKICGDALSADVVNQLRRMDPALHQKFLEFGEKVPSYGVRFYSPDFTSLNIKYGTSGEMTPGGYISRRFDFDHFLLEEVRKLSDIKIFEDCRINEIRHHENMIILTAGEKIFHSKMVVGADGAHSIVKKALAGELMDKKHYSAGIRTYYENVATTYDGKFIELHFYKEVLPGYFWIFPLPGNRANVGLGIPTSTVSKNKINLKELLKDIIANHPNVKDRFANARELDGPAGFGLPLGSVKRKISGDNFLLVGDAAGLIDPFTGEGIGNAIRSGRIAANHLLSAIRENRFDAAFNRKYDKELYGKIWNELRIGYSLQKLLRFPKLFDFVLRKAQKNKSVRILLTSMLEDAELKKKLLQPSFYFNLLFDKGGGDNLSDQDGSSDVRTNGQ